MKVLSVILLCAALLAACASPRQEFVDAVSEFSEVAIPQHKLYISADDKIPAAEKLLRIKSCDQYLEMVREEKARQK